MADTTYDQFCIAQRSRADAHLAEFLAGHPEYRLEEQAPGWLKGTHLVAFGTSHDCPIVFKYYDGDPRKAYEERALRLYQPTGLVPRILASTDVMLVMERLPGLTLLEREKELTATERNELYASLGEVVARVVETAPGGDQTPAAAAGFRAAEPDEFYATPFDALFVELYRNADTTTLFDTTLRRTGRVLEDRQVPQKRELSEALLRLQDHRDAILSYPDFLSMDDFHPNNIMAQNARVTGFIDLEMTSFGNEPLLLAGVLTGLAPDAWRAFRGGYENVRGRDRTRTVFELASVAAPFSAFVHFTWYWSTDDQPWWTKVEDFRSMAVRGITAAVQAAGVAERMSSP